MYLGKLVLARSIAEDFLKSICSTLFRKELKSYGKIEFEEDGAEVRQEIRGMVNGCLGEGSVTKCSAVD